MPSENDRYVDQSPFYMGRNEKKAFTLDTTPWGGSPATPVCTLFDITDVETDVSGTKLSGSASVAGAIITTPLVQLLTVGSQYLLEIKWTKGSDINAALLIIHGTK